MQSKSTLVPSLTVLQQRAAREIVTLVRRENRRSGDHLTEVELSDHIGISRSPVQVALKYLATQGLVQQDANRGHFMTKDAKQWDAIAAQLASAPDDPMYLRIAEDRRSGALPNEVTEAGMMRRYRIARGGLRKLLARMSEEGWVEQNVGHGWSFLPMIDSPEAYDESYHFRQAIEPIGVLNPSFCFDSHVLNVLRMEQQRIVDGAYRTMSPIELFEANSRFHETVASWSQNRFITQSIRRVNLQRRLVEYHQASNRLERKTQAQEHLAILDAISRHDVVEAAGLLRGHLDRARRAKAYAR